MWQGDLLRNYLGLSFPLLELIRRDGRHFPIFQEKQLGLCVLKRDVIVWLLQNVSHGLAMEMGWGTPDGSRKLLPH